MPAKGYRCRVCGKRHKELPLHYGAAAPYVYYGIPEVERADRVLLTSESVTHHPRRPPCQPTSCPSRTGRAF